MLLLTMNPIHSCLRPNAERPPWDTVSNQPRIVLTLEDEDAVLIVEC